MTTEKILRTGCLILILFLGLATWIGYTLYKNIDFSPLANRYEDMLKKHIVPHILDNWEPWEDENAQTTLDSITTRLLQAIPEPSYEYQFHLVKEMQVNALTLPGGHIVIFEGLMKEAHNPEQIAAVLAHELGHAEMKHVLTRTLAEGGISLTLSILLGQDTRMGYELSRQIINSYFSREQESEADAWGFKLLVDAHIHPKAHADFFRNIEKLYEGDEVPSWLSTHPENGARIQAAERYTLPANFKEIPLDTLAFYQLQLESNYW